jgi:hypothetical protein
VVDRKLDTTYHFGSNDVSSQANSFKKRARQSDWQLAKSTEAHGGGGSITTMLEFTSKLLQRKSTTEWLATCQVNRSTEAHGGGSGGGSITTMLNG